MGELKLSVMEAVKNLESEDELTLLRDYIITDPKDMTHLINFFKQESLNATGDYRKDCEKTLNILRTQLMARVSFTNRVYAIEKEETKVPSTPKPVAEVKTETPPVKEETPAPVVETVVEDKKESNLKVVSINGKDVENNNSKDMREKYQQYIKTVNINDLKGVVKAFFDENEVTKGTELATFILGNALYKNNNPKKPAKKWSATMIEKFIEECMPITPAEEVNDTNETVIADTDFYEKYKAFLGDNKMSVDMLRSEVRFMLGTNKVDEGLELATFILGSGEYVPNNGEETKAWSSADIEAFILEVKQGLIDNPMSDLNPPDATPVLPAAAIEAEKQNIKWDISADKLISTISNMALEGKSHDEIKSFIFSSAKEQKVELLYDFYGVEKDQKEIDEIYSRIFETVVNGKQQERIETEAAKSVNITDYITREVEIEVNKEAKGVTRVIKDLKNLFIKRGENTTLKECKDLIYNLTREKFPDFYNKMTQNSGENKPSGTPPQTDNPAENKVTIINEEKPFNEEYPTLYEQVKDAKCLNDVYTMAREMEKSQDFTVVARMIMHLISSGKISDAVWDRAQIELWINTVYKTNPEEDSKSTESAQSTVEDNKPVEGANSNDDSSANPPTVEVASSDVASTQDTASPTLDSQADTVAPEQQTTQEVGSSSVETVQTHTVSLPIPEGIVVAVEDKEYYEAFYVDQKNKDLFFKGIADRIKEMQAEGKTSKVILHEITDKIHNLSVKAELSRCFIRNYKNESVNNLTKTVLKLAKKAGITGLD